MKKLLIPALLFLISNLVEGQVTKTDVLTDLEKNQTVVQNSLTTATISTATRLFKDKDDLTSVIVVVPIDSTVIVLGSDDTFLKVDYLGNSGFIYSKHAVINRDPDPVAIPEPQAAPEQPQEAVKEYSNPQKNTISRYDYLEKKYGTSMASKLYNHKIWKGMNAQMAKDSWGSPGKITREISGNTVNEEWYYKNTWLRFQNSTLIDWGPVK